MISRLLREFGQLKDTCIHEGAGPALSLRLEREHGLILPNEHKEMLRLSNGVEAYAGYLRLFGVFTMESIDLTVWNDPNYWKFAWGDRSTEYLCFGETGWGDQYGYSYRSLRTGKQQVYHMDAVSMATEVIASSFAEFLEKEFFRMARSPYDTMTPAARKKLGPLELNSHVVYVPSSLLTGVEDINSVQKMNARAAMIANGDIALQLDAAPDDASIKAIEPYEDEAHRTRLRLVWE